MNLQQLRSAIFDFMYIVLYHFSESCIPSYTSGLNDYCDVIMFIINLAFDYSTFQLFQRRRYTFLRHPLYGFPVLTNHWLTVSPIELSIVLHSWVNIHRIWTVLYFFTTKRVILSSAFRSVDEMNVAILLILLWMPTMQTNNPLFSTTLFSNLTFWITVVVWTCIYRSVAMQANRNGLKRHFLPFIFMGFNAIKAPLI